MCSVSTGRRSSGVYNLQLLQAVKADIQSTKQYVPSAIVSNTSCEDSDSSSATIDRVTATKVAEIEASSVSENSTKEIKETTQKNKKKRSRKRKKLLPGFTATNRERMFVEHHYHDHSNDSEQDYVSDVNEPGSKKRKKQHPGGVIVPFPLKLHELLDQLENDGFASIMSWQPHGRAFVIHDKKRFAKEIMPKYFKQTRFTSFQRQLNLYGFVRLSRGQDNGAYYHELFLRGKVFLCKKMTRTKCKGTGLKAAGDPDTEPDFFAMPFIGEKSKQEEDADRKSIEEPSKVSIESTESICGSLYGSCEDSQDGAYHEWRQQNIQPSGIPATVNIIKHEQTPSFVDFKSERSFGVEPEIPSFDDDLIDEMIIESCLSNDAGEDGGIVDFPCIYLSNSLQSPVPAYDYNLPVDPVPLLAPRAEMAFPHGVPVQRRESNYSVTISSDFVNASTNGLEDDDELRQCLEMLLD